MSMHGFEVQWFAVKTIIMTRSIEGDLFGAFVASLDTKYQIFELVIKSSSLITCASYTSSNQLEPNFGLHIQR